MCYPFSDDKSVLQNFQYQFIILTAVQEAPFSIAIYLHLSYVIVIIV